MFDTIAEIGEMSHLETVIPFAYGCDCQQDLRPEQRIEKWKNCECTFCGPLLENGSRKCKVQVSPLLMCATALQSRFREGDTVPAFCVDCRKHCLLVRRCDAVIRARKARKYQMQGIIADRSRSRSCK